MAKFTTLQQGCGGSNRIRSRTSCLFIVLITCERFRVMSLYYASRSLFQDFPFTRYLYLTDCRRGGLHDVIDIPLGFLFSLVILEVFCFG